ncbi:uncharacterized protein H6S33_004747 [Morchella sextelata]|uniref:uncharacterized protein n=1 Tax=Morchella sextelata TaxID=1174677 RepID=UPI001D047BCA|nr:uncharacterized protein H6S33_004747 [Morchella sextelata]KAH0605525.1 hypothetical protein H6S33_004747 [Morchella sextelata]
MSDDDVDQDLLAFMRKALGLDPSETKAHPTTKVLESALYIFDNSIDVALDRDCVMQAAETIYDAMQKKAYGTSTWSEHELHPQEKNEDTLNFIFTMDVLNFSFWSGLEDEKRFSVDYGGKRYTGYWSLVALLRRALDEGIPITCPYFWVDHTICSDDLLAHVFRSATDEQIPLLQERIDCLREAGERYDGRFANCVKEANGSAAALVVLLGDEFTCFRDEHKFEGRRVNIYKRAQILAADIWACFNKKSYGHFTDIDTITMFADYRVPVILHALGCLLYSPPLEAHIKAKKLLDTGHPWEVQLRGTSIWCVELIRRQIQKMHPETGNHINAILIDFYLYDTAKEMERNNEKMIPHHRTRSIWY